MQKSLEVASVKAPFVLGTRPIPAPGHGQLLVKVLAAALNPLDAYMRAIGIFVSSWPLVSGWDGAGVVESVGEGVSGFVKGDKM